MMKNLPIRIGVLILVIAFSISAASAYVGPPEPPINEPPIADAGGPYGGDEGSSISFDGSGSYDDGSIESYGWDFGDGGTGTGVSPSHTYEEDGEYTVTLTVTDDEEMTDTDTSEVTVTAITPPPPATPDEVIEKADDAIATINGLDSENFRNPYNQQRLTNKLNLVILLVIRERYNAARYELQYDLLPRMDGCANTEGDGPDSNDWITTCEAQDKVYPLITEMIELLEALTAAQNAVLDEAKDAIATINGLDSEDFRNQYSQQRLINKLNLVILLVNQGRYDAARYELQNDILPRMDGCAETEAPDGNDWIIDCAAQQEVCQHITKMIDLLTELT